MHSKGKNSAIDLHGLQTNQTVYNRVVLGSFSNYLVMHSSVPVMVARKKLKKQTKNKKMNVRLSNNLTTPKKLALAKVD